MKIITQNYENDKKVSSSIISNESNNCYALLNRCVKEYKSLSYDVINVYIAIVFTIYMILAVETKQTTDSGTLGEIFYLISDELTDIKRIEAFHMIIKIFMETLSDKLSLTSEQLNKLMNSFLLALLKQLKGSLALCA